MLPDPPAPIQYTIWADRRVQEGTAEALLRSIKESGKVSNELKSMSLAEYARALVDDAPFFLPQKLRQYFESQPMASDYERALEYLSAMPTSGVRILARR